VLHATWSVSSGLRRGAPAGTTPGAVAAVLHVARLLAPSSCPLAALGLGAARA